MKDRIQKLCKRLNKFTLEEIALIAEVEESEAKNTLNDLIKGNFLKKQNDSYIYIEEKKSANNHLPIMFQCHSPDTINMLIKCFCAEIPSTKSSFLLGFSPKCSCSFNDFFRKIIYEKQKQELVKHFERQPKMGRFRKYFNKTFYFYPYGKTLYLSDELLIAKTAQPFSKSEIKEFKIMHSMLSRRLNHNTFKNFVHLHLAEHIWRYRKEFSELENELKSLLVN